MLIDVLCDQSPGRKKTSGFWQNTFNLSRLFRKLISFSEELEELDLRYNLIGDLGGKEVVEGLKIRNRGEAGKDYLLALVTRASSWLKPPLSRLAAPAPISRSSPLAFATHPI